MIVHMKSFFLLFVFHTKAGPTCLKDKCLAKQTDESMSLCLSLAFRGWDKMKRCQERPCRSLTFVHVSVLFITWKDGEEKFSQSC